MGVDWSTSAAPLLLDLERGGLPLRTQLETQLRDAIQSGRLAAGERVPATRELAAQLGISRGIAQDCYAQLIAEGYLVAQSGSATRVARLHRSTATEPETTLPAAPRYEVEFPSGVPDLRLVPRLDWAWAVREACRILPNALFDYGDPAGDPMLREVLAAYLRRVRAADTDADHILVCGGFAQGLILVASALVAHGITRIAHENPGSGGTVRAAAAAAGGEAVPVAVDEQGIIVESLQASGARAVVVTAAHQWPTGVVLAPGRRHELLDWAVRNDGVIIEDEYDAEFRYDREPVGLMQGLARDRVVTLGTVSKSLAPALRLGWAVLPTHLRGAATAAKQVADRGTPALDQRALALLIESGRYDRHLRQMRTKYARRRTMLVRAVERRIPESRISGLAAGFHAVLHLPPHVDEATLVAEASRRGLGVSGMQRYYSTSDAEPPRLVLGFGNTPTESIERGVELLADILHSREFSANGA